MHISEGILSAPVLVGGAIAAAAGLSIGLRRVRQENLCEIALLSSAFFIASLVHVPVMGANAHLILNGLLGLVLGWAAFPAVFVALLLQATMFQFGGITTLGLNTFILAAPAVVVSVLFSALSRSNNIRTASLAGAAAGAMAIMLSAALASLALYWGGEGETFLQLSKVLFAVHVPIMVTEGLICGFAVSFLRQVYPRLLKVAYVPEA